jgi:hypothetical protein
MATYTKFQQFVEDLAHGVHNFDSNTIKVAFSNASNAPSASLDKKLADITTIASPAVDSVTLTKSSSGQTSGTYKYVPNDLTMTASGAVGPFQYVIIYNDTATDGPLICFFDYGSEVTLAKDDTFKLDFGTELFSLS